MANIRGNDNDNVLAGTGSADRIRGDKGDDTLRGGAGNDQLEGDDGNDQLLGGTGRDTVDGGKGDDLLTGGVGNDVFRFGNNEGSDTITDFADGFDRIKLSAPGIANFGDLTITADLDGNAVVSFFSGGPSEIVLLGVSVADLSASDFIFSPG